MMLGVCEVDQMDCLECCFQCGYAMLFVHLPDTDRRVGQEKRMFS